MPNCVDCGNYTKYQNGRCSSCYYGKKSKVGKVYFGKVSWPSGKSTIYTGQTKRKVYERVGEHLSSQRKGNSRTYTGRGIAFKLLGSIFSSNRFKAEKTAKSLSRSEKEGLARYGASRYGKKKKG